MRLEDAALGVDERDALAVELEAGLHVVAAQLAADRGERTLPVLEAAHIKPYSESGPHLVSNGLLLRSDLHILFDEGYVTVNEDLRVEVSERIREQYENGREYYQYRGKPLLVVPGGADERPGTDFLRWHNEEKYLG